MKADEGVGRGPGGPPFYQEIRPSRRLRSYVECYWFLEERQGRRNDFILPDGCVDILFSALKGEPVGLTAVGLMTSPLPCAMEAGQRFFGVRFRPGMAAGFLREAALLNDKTEPLENLWGATARSIYERLAALSDAREMALVMDGFLRPAEPPDAAQRALFRLQPNVPLEQLASDAGLSERHFRRACLERAGVSPKYLARILRFRQVAERIRATQARAAQPSWAQLAVACGYFDQAHLIREFQEFSGATPGRFLQSQQSRGDLESDHDEQNQTRKSD